MFCIAVQDLSGKVNFIHTPERDHCSTYETFNMLQGKCYFQVDMVNAKTVWDVGANVGSFSFWMKCKYLPDAKFHLFEPQAGLRECLTVNAGVIGAEYHSFGLENVGEGERKVTLFGSGTYETLENSIRSGSGEGEEIMIRDAGQVALELGCSRIDVLKMDTEGCEVQILKSLQNAKISIGTVYLEYHSEDDRLEIDQLLKGTHILARSMSSNQGIGVITYIEKGL